jgi:two-component system sensor histidine kinase KdpD
MLRPTLEWCEPLELASEAIRQAALAAGQVHLDAGEDLPPMRVDGGLVTQALATLLHNAATHGAAYDPVVLIVRRDAEFVRFEVADRGPGLPPGMEEKVFQKFFRAPGVPAGGVGLGLSIARGLVEALGGTLVGGELHLPE